MSFKAIAWAFEQKGLTCCQKFTLLTLANYTNQDNNCWPSQTTLARDTGLCRHKVNETIGELEGKGLIKITRRKLESGAETSCIYTLLYPVAEGVTPCRPQQHPPVASGVTNLLALTSKDNQDLCPTRSDIVVVPEKRPKTTMAYSQDFESFWQSYPDRTNNSKPRAFAEWQKLSEVDRGLAASGIPAFSAYCRKNKDYRAVHCERYLSQRRFESWSGGQAVRAAPIYFKV